MLAVMMAATKNDGLNLKLSRIIKHLISDTKVVRMFSSMPDHSKLDRKPTPDEKKFAKEPITASSYWFLGMISQISDKTSAFFESGYFNNAAQMIVFGIFLVKSIKCEQDIAQKMDKLDELAIAGNTLISQLKDIYQNTYASRKEKGISLIKINQLNSELNLVSKQLETIRLEFEKISYGFINTVTFGRKRCKANARLAFTQIKHNDSYHQIAMAMFHCHIKQHKDAFKSIISALQLYIEALDYRSKKSEIFSVLEKLSKYIDEKSNFNPVFFENFVTELASLYKKEHREWFSDILNYIGYVIFDSFNNVQQTSQLTLYPLLFLQLACQVNPTNCVALNNIGFVYRVLGHSEKSRDFFEKSIELNHSLLNNDLEKFETNIIVTSDQSPISIRDIITLEEQFTAAANITLIDKLWAETNLATKASFLFKRPITLDKTNGKIGSAKLSALFYEDISTWKQIPGIESIEQIPIPNRCAVIYECK